LFGWLNPAKLPPVATELNIVKHDLVLLFTRDLQAGGPHVARPSVFSGWPAETFRKNLQT